MIGRRELLGAGAFALASGSVSAASLAVSSLQTEVPPGRDNLLLALPPKVAGWRIDASQDDLVDPFELDPAFAAELSLYTRVVGHDYVAPTRPRIMLSIAYKRTIEQEARFHWPEFCYATQGFQVTRLPAVPLGPQAPELKASRFLGERIGRRELVCYLMRIGDSNPTGSVALRASLFRQSLAMRVPDGTLVRASLLLDDQVRSDLASGTATVLAFLNGLLAASSPPVRSLLVS